MKKLIYIFLAVSIIFTACKKEEDEVVTPTVISGCMDVSAINYNANATNDDGSCTYDLVGKWTLSNLIIDSTLTVSYEGETIDSLSSSGSRTLPAGTGLVGSLNLDFMSNGTVWDGNDILGYTINGSILVVEDIGSFHYVIANSNLSLTSGEEVMQEEEIYLENGSSVMADVYYLYTNTLNFTRNTSGMANNNVNQRVGNINHDWFVKSKFKNILKSLK